MLSDNLFLVSPSDKVYWLSTTRLDLVNLGESLEPWKKVQQSNYMYGTLAIKSILREAAATLIFKRPNALKFSENPLKTSEVEWKVKDL